ncbi:MAG: FAD-dependent oxidoreductase [Acidobacteria bacterium]|nr:FAD-dependent oxidoreductase [Acidobacteriota bacterium]
MNPEYEMAIIGAGSGGLTAASFAARLGARVALVEKARIGGDCTWTGCVPSKALLKAAKVAHEVRTAAQYGIRGQAPEVAMHQVREYVRTAIQKVYQFESPEELHKQGIEVILGPARFIDEHTIAAGELTVNAKSFLITTGARPATPAIDGIGGVPFVTYEQIFDNDRLPERMIVVGGGPVGAEIAQAYRRLGSQVTVVARTLLPKEEPEARACIEEVFEREGIQIARGRASSARRDGEEIVVATDGREVRGDLLLVASGRKPNVGGLDLEKAGVSHSAKGIPVDDQLRTNVKHIYAAGDVVGGHQFTHFAGWQAFQAVRNALLPGHASGFTDVVPWVTFTDPEVAHVGLTEEAARAKFGDRVKVCRWEMSHTDRAICENDAAGFIKLVAKDDGTVTGATIVAARAGEAITELILAIRHNWKVTDLAGAIHAYPTYSTAVQQMAADMAIENLLSGPSGRILLGLSKIIR